MNYTILLWKSMMKSDLPVNYKLSEMTACLTAGQIGSACPSRHTTANT